MAVDDEHEDEQDPAEVAAQYAPGGPVAAAYAWARAIGDPDTFYAAWTQGTGEPFRSEVVKRFLDANVNSPRPLTRQHSRAEVLRRLATGEHQTSEPGDRFRIAQARTFAEALQPVLSGEAGAASKPRAVGVDLELVLFVDLGGATDWQPGQQADIPVTLTMHRDGDRWVVVGFNDPSVRWAT